jgi:riboflavin kinase
VRGRVFSGGGGGAKFMKLPWVTRQIAEKLGFTPYPGTLNLRMTESGGTLKEWLRNAEPVEILPVEGFCRGRCFKAFFMNTLKCAVLIPEVENYPEDIVEVIASMNLRERFKLKDGDMVNVQIMR